MELNGPLNFSRIGVKWNMTESHEEQKRNLEIHLEKLSSLLDELTRSLQEPSLLQPEEEKKEETKRELALRFDSLSRKMKTGFQTTLQAITDMSAFLDATEVTELTQAFAQVALIHDSIDKQWKSVLEKMVQGEEIAEVLGLSHDGLAGMYHLGQRLLEYQHFDESVACFCLLSLLVPEQPIFWMGLGHSEYCSGRYTDASIAYTMASEIDEQNPAPHLSMAYCYRAMREDHLIPYCFELAKDSAKTAKEKQQVEESVLRLKEAWKLTA